MPLDESQGHSLAPLGNTGNKPGKRKQAIVKTDPKQAVSNTQSIIQTVGQEVDQTAIDLRQSVQGYANYRADEVAGVVAELPEMFANALEQKLGSLEVDRDGFRKLRDELKGCFAIPSRES